MAFDLTSTQEISNDFILPEFTNCLFGHRQLWRRSRKKCPILFMESVHPFLCVEIEKTPKTNLWPKLAKNNFWRKKLTNRCKLLIHRFAGIFPADFASSSVLKKNFYDLANECFTLGPTWNPVICFLLKLDGR